jgi:hypothetical protein
LEAELSPSEDPEKVMSAMVGIIGPGPFTVSKRGGGIRIDADSPGTLDRVHDQLRDRRVRGAARRRLLAGRHGSESTVMVNRQAASAGVVAICDSEDESPLGPIYLTVRSDDFDRLLAWLTDYPAG